MLIDFGGRGGGVNGNAICLGGRAGVWPSVIIGGSLSLTLPVGVVF